MSPRHFTNAALARMRADEPALGMLVRLARTGDIAGIAAASGHDFLFLDLQHSAMDPAAVTEIALAAYGFGVAPLVRIPGPGNPDATRLLDAGVMGVVVPDVGNAQDARRAVDACKFEPVGRRSVAAGYAMLGFDQVPLAQATRIMNRETLVACMIETAEGLDNLEAIVATEGVDVVHLGCNDLLVSLGRPGEFGCDVAEDAVRRLLDACRRHRKFAGLGGDRDVERQRRFIREGGRFLTTQSDMAFLQAEATRRATALRGG